MNTDGRATTRWRAASADHLLVRSWDGECVIYDLRTGDTHLLEAFPASVFAALLEEALVPSDVAKRCSLGRGPSVGADDRTAVERALLEFERLGLAESTAS